MLLLLVIFCYNESVNIKMRDVPGEIKSLDLDELMEEFDISSDEAIWPEFEVKKTNGDFEVEANMKDLVANDIYVDLTDDYLCVSSPKKGSEFKKEFSLPFQVDLGKVDVKMDDGNFWLRLKKSIS